jgi:aminotransferase
MYDPVGMVEEYRKRRDYVCERLTNMGLDVVKPEGAFYVFPSIKNAKMTSFDFALRLLQETSVAVVPGDSFSGGGEGYLRMSYAASIEMLEEGLNRMEQFIHSINGKPVIIKQ